MVQDPPVKSISSSSSMSLWGAMIAYWDGILEFMDSTQRTEAVSGWVRVLISRRKSGEDFLGRAVGWVRLVRCAVVVWRRVKGSPDGYPVGWVRGGRGRPSERRPYGGNSHSRCR